MNNLAALAIHSSGHFLGFTGSFYKLTEKKSPFPQDLSNAAANVAVTTRDKMR